MALRVLWKFHDKEFQSYRENISSHPSFQQKFQEFKDALSSGSNSLTPQVMKLFENKWLSKISVLDKSTWEMRREKCLTIFRNHLEYSDPVRMTGGLHKLQKLFTPGKKGTKKYAFLFRSETNFLKRTWKEALNKFCSTNVSVSEGVEFIEVMYNTQRHFCYLVDVSLVSLLGFINRTSLEHKNPINFYEIIDQLLARGYEEILHEYIEPIQKWHKLLNSYYNSSWHCVSQKPTYFAPEDLQTMKEMYNRAESELDKDPHDENLKVIKEALTKLLYRFMPYDDDFYGAPMKTLEDFKELRVLLDALTKEVEIPDMQ